MNAMHHPIESATDAARRAFARSPVTATASPSGWWPFVAGLAVGAFMMYMSDPVSGRRRRSTTRQSASRLTRVDAMRPARKRLKDLSNRAQGMAHELTHHHDDDETVSDEQLEQRVKTALGHLSHEPSAIEVQVEDGHVELTGQVGRMEQRAVVHGVKQVRGTRAVTNRMEAVDEKAASSKGD